MHTNRFLQSIGHLISQATPSPLSLDKIVSLLESPPKPEMGDYAFPCFELSKELRKSPAQIAKEIAEKIPASPLFTSIEAAGPYINFRVNPPLFYEEILTSILQSSQGCGMADPLTPPSPASGRGIKGDNLYGSSKMGAGKTIVIDYSSPNMARPLNIAHLGTTAVGAALRNIYQFLGYRVVGINYLGDWGTQFGKLIVAFRHWGDLKELESHAKPVLYLVDLYIRFHQEAESNPILEEEARAALLACEEGNPEILELWRLFCSLSRIELDKIYERLGIRFDVFDGESQYNKVLDQTIENIRRKGLAKESEGALIAELDKYGLPPMLLRRSDGASLYSTRDIAAAVDRFNRYHFDKMIYVVGSEQRLHFEQLFSLLKEMGYPWADRCTHLSLGQVSLEGQKMSTRKGQVVFLDDLLDKAEELAENIIEEKNPGLAHKNEIAKEVAIGAILFNRFSQRQNKDVVFEWDRALSFEGETGPYLQYTHARACSVLRKGGEGQGEGIDFTLLGKPEEHELVKLFERWPSRVEIAAYQNEPYIVARHLLDIAAAFNKFYNLHRVIDPTHPKLQLSRLALVAATRHILATGLLLLGISAPEQM